MTAIQLPESLNRFPRAGIGHFPTPIESLPNLSASLGLSLTVKRDDCSGIAFGGNKIRQLDFYLGQALADKADTILITGARQSNFVRSAAALACQLGMQCHAQLEERVTDASPLYRSNGNVLLDRLLGASIHHYPDGEDEAGADAALVALADTLRAQGRRPYPIALGADSSPLGALGYVVAAQELLMQLQSLPPVDEVVVASGSALTHAGLLFGLRLLGSQITVQGICVRRDAQAQTQRVTQRLHDLKKFTGLSPHIGGEDVNTFDGALAPGYGRLADSTLHAIQKTARLEGLLLDPVYTGKTMAGLFELNRLGQLTGARVLFWHTGGTPALFAYADQLES